MLDWLLPSVIATLVGTVILIVAYSFLYFQDRQPFLKIWTIGWGIYGLRFVFQIWLLLGGNEVLLQIAIQSSSLISGFFLIWGTSLFAGRAFHKVWLVGTGIGVSWIIVAELVNLPFTLVNLPTFTFLALEYIWTGFFFIQFESISGRFHQFTGWIFILWGIHKADYPFLRPVAWFAPWGYMLGFIFELSVALGILLTYIHKTRQDLENNQAHFQKISEATRVVIFRLGLSPTIEFQYLSPAVEALTGYTIEELTQNPGVIKRLIPRDDLKLMISYLSRNTFPKDVIIHRVKCKNGKDIWVEFQGIPVYEPGNELHLVAIDGTIKDITDRKITQDYLRQEATTNQCLAELAKATINSTYSIADIASLVLDYTKQLTNSQNGYVSFIKPTNQENTILAIANGRSTTAANIILSPAPDGKYSGLLGRSLNNKQGYFDNEPVVEPLPDGFPIGNISNILSVSARLDQALVGQITLMNKSMGYSKYELDLVQQIADFYAVALQNKYTDIELKKSAELLQSVVTGAPVIIFSLDQHGIFTLSEGRGLDSLGLKPGEVVGQSVYDFYQGFPEIMDQVNHALAGEAHVSIAEVTGIFFETHYTPIKDDQGKTIGAIGVATEVTKRVQAEQSTHRQLEKLKTLHAIDQIITASTSLDLTLNFILEQIANHLKASAVDILLLENSNHRLKYIAGRGFSANNIIHTQLPLGQGYAGQVAIERRLLCINNFSAMDTNDYQPPNYWHQEGFVAYFGLPLIVKGQVKGVLELFYSQPLYPDEEYMDFLGTLASQAAMALDNAILFDNLQRTNMELLLAYDTTLEGWAKALELRDKETEGHCQRVTSMAVQLAQKMGIRREELIHIRRGALLHDIGKMGIPDKILQKPGPLNEEEWEIMKLHPTYAYNLISDIAFLQPALDIPYHHHEHWDGKGYPLGLAGHQIPLAARIFSVIDTWDALSSDRPYRKKWCQTEVLSYIRQLAGIQFDPEVVTAFVSLFDTPDYLPVANNL